MTSSYRWAAYSAFAGFATVGLGCLIALGFNGPARLPATAIRPVVHVQLDKVVVVVPAQNGYYDQLRSRLRWVQTRMGKEQLPTLDLDSRMLLAKSAARKARLHEVGLNFQDVYGIINAETSWVPRSGASKDGTPNLGIAHSNRPRPRHWGCETPTTPSRRCMWRRCT